MRGTRLTSLGHMQSPWAGGAEEKPERVQAVAPEVCVRLEQRIQRREEVQRGDQALGQWEAVVPQQRWGWVRCRRAPGLPGWGSGSKGRMGMAADTAPRRVDRRGEWLKVPTVQGMRPICVVRLRRLRRPTCEEPQRIEWVVERSVATKLLQVAGGPHKSQCQGIRGGKHCWDHLPVCPHGTGSPLCGGGRLPWQEPCEGSGLSDLHGW